MLDEVGIKAILDLGPEWGGVELLAEGETRGAGYVCSTEVVPLDGGGRLWRWRVRREGGGAFTVRDFRVEAAVPGLDVHRVFVPVLHGAIGKVDRISLPWSVDEGSYSAWSFPLIALLNRADVNRFCMAFMNHVDSAVASESCYDEDVRTGLRRVYEKPLQTEEWSETLYLSRAPRHVFDEVRAFSRVYERETQTPPCRTPAAAWEPVWCSWYGIKNDVNAAYVLEMAPLLKAWGFGSVIIDAGWFEEDGFDEETGHYVPDTNKFPDLGRMIRQLQEQGLRVLLWCAPLFRLGSILEHPFVERNLLRARDGAPSNLCPRVAEVRQYVRRMVGHLMREYGADGLKIDMVDALQGPENHVCAAGHPHDIDSYGRAVRDLFRAIHDEVKAVKPDALIEFRMNYSNPATRPFATSHRAQDAPYDYDHIRRMCTRLKSYMLDPEKGAAGNVAVHTDPAYWHPDESDETVARFMASLVCSGVPMLSTDLRTLSAEHARIVRAWLGFFRRHRDLLLFGRHRCLSADPHYSVFGLERGAEGLLGVFAEAFPGELPVAPGLRCLWLLNGSGRGRVYGRLLGVGAQAYTARLYDRGLELQNSVAVDAAAGCLPLDLEVEVGGAVELVAAD